jgi:hypothetical protein
MLRRCAIATDDALAPGPSALMIASCWRANFVVASSNSGASASSAPLKSRAERPLAFVFVFSIRHILPTAPLFTAFFLKINRLCRNHPPFRGLESKRRVAVIDDQRHFSKSLNRNVARLARADETSQPSADAGHSAAQVSADLYANHNDEIDHGN